MRIGVIGGGMTGLVLAYRLTKKGHKVTVFEKEETGGFAGTLKVNNVSVEKYYHHIFKNETAVQDLLSELGLEVMWISSKVGMYHKGRIADFGTPFDLLKLPFLSIFDKIRLGIFTLLVPKLSDWKKLERIPAENWLVKYLGKRTYNVIWKPLLVNKFGEHYKKVPASYVWERLRMRTTSKHNILQSENLGYIEGSFQVLIDRLKEEIVEKGGRVFENNKVVSIKESHLSTEEGEYEFDKIISTIALPEFLKIAPKISKEYKKELQDIKYSHVECLMLLLKKSLSDYYWVNIHENKCPFDLFVEHTNLMPMKLYGSNIVYVSSYITDKRYSMPEKKVLKIYTDYLKKIFPNFKKSWIIKHHLSKEKYSNPLIELNFSKKMLKHKTPVEGLYIVERSQLPFLQQGVDNCIRLVDRFLDSVPEIDSD